MSATLPSVNQSNAADDNAKLEKKIDALNSDWTNLPKTHALHHFGAAIGGAGGILADAGYNEMYGVGLVAGTGEYVSMLRASRAIILTNPSIANPHRTPPSLSYKNSYEQILVIWN